MDEVSLLILVNVQFLISEASLIKILEERYKCYISLLRHEKVYQIVVFFEVFSKMITSNLSKNFFGMDSRFNPSPGHSILIGGLSNALKNHVMHRVPTMRIDSTWFAVSKNIASEYVKCAEKLLVRTARN